MGRKLKRERPKPRRPKWQWAALGAIVLMAAGVAAFWWLSEAQSPSGGKPRLMVDRTELDLGDFPLERQAKAVFTLTNAGDGPLRILEVPPVSVLQGC